MKLQEQAGELIYLCFANYRVSLLLDLGCAMTLPQTNQLLPVKAVVCGSRRIVCQMIVEGFIICGFDGD